MKILKACLHGFRNHVDTVFDFGLRMNVLMGDNGQGKTNTLEALSYCCLTKSFYASADTTVLQRGKELFEVTAKLEADNGKEFAVRVVYEEASKTKKFTINNIAAEKFSSVIGIFPVVILSPENNSITFGSPADRRKFIDLVVSQSSASYIEDAMEYRKVLRQRNKILSDAQGNDCAELLAPWNEMLINYGIRILQKRGRFIQEFAPYITNAYSKIAGEKEAPGIAYDSVIPLTADSTDEEIRKGLEQKLQRRYKDELRFKTTLVGPHRDEITFTLNGLQLKHYASQGQHKTFLVALKAAEFFYLKERCNETPVFLLDDIFSELDEYRSQKLLNLVESLGQTFITATSEKIFGGTNWNTEKRKFLLSNGRIVNEALAA